MNNTFVDNNYINVINIYNQMFPRLDNDVIKMVLEENSDEVVLDILLQLSETIPSPSSSRPSSPKLSELESYNQNIPSYSSLPVMEPSTPTPSHTSTLSYKEPDDNKEYDEFDSLFGHTETNRPEPGLLNNLSNRLFKRNVSKDYSKLDRFNPDDEL